MTDNQKFIMTLLTASKDTKYDGKAVKDAGKNDVSVEQVIQMLASGTPTQSARTIARDVALLEKPLLNNDELKFLRDNFTPKQILKINTPKAVNNAIERKFDMLSKQFRERQLRGRERIEKGSGGGFTFAGEHSVMEMYQFKDLNIKQKIAILKQYQKEVNKLKNKENFLQAHADHIVGKVERRDGDSLEYRVGEVEGDKQASYENYKRYQDKLNKYLGRKDKENLKNFGYDERDRVGVYRKKFKAPRTPQEKRNRAKKLRTSKARRPYMKNGVKITPNSAGTVYTSKGNIIQLTTRQQKKYGVKRSRVKIQRKKKK